MMARVRAQEGHDMSDINDTIDKAQEKASDARRSGKQSVKQAATRAEKAAKVKKVNAQAGDSLAVDAVILELE